MCRDSLGTPLAWRPETVPLCPVCQSAREHRGKELGQHWDDCDGAVVVEVCYVSLLVNCSNQASAQLLWTVSIQDCSEETREALHHAEGATLEQLCRHAINPCCLASLSFCKLSQTSRLVRGAFKASADGNRPTGIVLLQQLRGPSWLWAATQLALPVRMLAVQRPGAS